MGTESLWIKFANKTGMADGGFGIGIHRGKRKDERRARMGHLEHDLIARRSFRSC
jgi:hypothetical protein